MISVEKIAAILSEEMERDCWSDVDPYLLRMIAEGQTTRSPTASALADTLRRVLDRLSSEKEEV